MGWFEKDHKPLKQPKVRSVIIPLLPDLKLREGKITFGIPATLTPQNSLNDKHFSCVTLWLTPDLTDPRITALRIKT